MYFRTQQCLTVNYNLNNLNNLNVFIVFRILDKTGATLNGSFGNDNGGNDRYKVFSRDVIKFLNPKLKSHRCFYPH